MPSFFVVYSFQSPHVLLEFCSCMQLSATTFFLFFFLCVFPCPLVLCISVGNSVVYTCLFLGEVIVWSVFPVCAHCPAGIMVFIVPDRGLRGHQQWRNQSPSPPPPLPGLAVRIGKLVTWESWARFVRMGISLAMRPRTGL